MAAELAASEFQADELAGDEVLRRHAQASGQFRTQSVRMPSLRQQARDDVFAFESDQRRGILGLAVGEAIAFKDPTHERGDCEDAQSTWLCSLTSPFHALFATLQPFSTNLPGWPEERRCLSRRGGFWPPRL
jgi:hypothetical protein